MSRYNYCDTTDRIYFKEDTQTLKEIIIKEDACYRLNNLEAQLKEANDKNKWIKKQQESWNSTTKGTIKDLERQLEKAREEEIKFLNGLYIYEHNIPTISEIRYRILKLKEKGEDETRPRN